MKLASLVHLDRNARRAREIVGVLARYGLADWLAALDYDWLKGLVKGRRGERIAEVSQEVRIRLVLLELGTTFIKIGQILSTRADVVGYELAEELADLQSSTNPDPPDAIRPAIEEELGDSVDTLFATFEDEAFASASIAQVHRATLADGTAVAVKVQRAGVQEDVECDLDILEGLAELAALHLPDLRHYQPVETVRELRRTMRRELDFQRERRNLDEFARRFEDDDRVSFPRSVPDRSSRRVLTMTYLEGIPFTDTEALATTEHDLDALARTGATVFLDMVFRDGFYHSDPHPGNLLLMADGRIAVLDCGMAGRLDEMTADRVERMILAAVTQDEEELTDMVVEVGHVPPNLDRRILREDVTDLVADHATVSLDEFDLGGALGDLVALVRRHHIRLMPRLALLIRVLIVLEGTSSNLSPTFSLAELLRPYQKRALRRRYSPRRILGRARRGLRDWDRLLGALPRDMTEILRALRSGQLEVHLEHRRLEAAVDRLVLGVVVAALLVSSAQLWSVNAAPHVFGVSLLGLLGYVLSVVLGWKLIRRPKR